MGDKFVEIAMDFDIESMAKLGLGMATVQLMAAGIVAAVSAVSGAAFDKAKELKLGYDRNSAKKELARKFGVCGE